MPHSAVGSFRLKQKHFLQLWSDDSQLRREALIERALSIAQMREVTSRSVLIGRMASIAELLDVPSPSFSELEAHAQEHHLHAKAAHLGALDPA